MGRGRRSVELTPEFCERLLSMDPDEAVAELQDQGLSQAEARDVVLQLRQEAGVTAELRTHCSGCRHTRRSSSSCRRQASRRVA